MRPAAAIAAAVLAVVLPFAGARGAVGDTLGAYGPDVIEKTVEVKGRGAGDFTVFLKLPEGEAKPKGVVCLCLLDGTPESVRAHLRGGGTQGEVSRLVAYAKGKGFAVIGWGATRAWDSRANWNELEKAKAKALDASFDAIADAWNRAMTDLQAKHGLPANGYVMWGLSAGGQFALRLALRKPERFAAVHAHVPSSFDMPTEAGKSVLWCLTTGENETGYRRSLEFLAAARKKGYAIVYRAYPGRGHVSMTAAEALGRACYEYALARHAAAKGKSDMSADFRKAAFVADVVNLKVFPLADVSCVPAGYRMSLPDELRERWLAE